jgi:hypothetical protein
MQVDGFALKLRADNSVLQQWTTIPDRVEFPSGDVVFSASPGWQSETFEIVPYSWSEPDPPAAPSRINKFTVLSRLDADGLLQAMAGELWGAVERQTIAIDDPSLTSMLDKIGANAAKILAQ